MRLCITADDYGLTAEGNAAIEALAARGAVSAVSVMVHAGAELGGLDRLRATGVPLGLHLVLTRERPLSDALAGTSLLDGDGRLPGSWRRLFAKLTMRPRLRSRLGREAQAQRDRFLALGLPLAFVNSHEHVHLFPPLWTEVAALLARTPGVAVRTALGQRPRRARAGLLALASRLSWAVRPLEERLRLSPLGVDDSGRLALATLPRLFAAARAVRPPALAELVVHPAEHALLGSPELAALLDRHGVTMQRGALA